MPIYNDIVTYLTFVCMSEGGMPKGEGLVSGWFRRKGVSAEELDRRGKEAKAGIAANEKAAAEAETARQERARPLARELAETLRAKITADMDANKLTYGFDNYDVELSVIALAKKLVESDEKYGEVRPNEVMDFLNLRIGEIEDARGKRRVLGAVTMREEAGA
jgi:hypothetical protein